MVTCLRRDRVFLFSVLLILLFVVGPAQNVFAATLDQKQESASGGYYRISGSNDPIGQEFQPSLSILEAVEVWINSPALTADLTLTVRTGSVTGTILVTATKSLTLPDNTPQWIHFDLGSVSVTPGATYVIRLTTTDLLPFFWGASDGNPYPGGRSIQSGVAVPDTDMAFRTYGPDIVVTLSASPSSVTVTAGGSASTTITFHISAGEIVNPVIACSGLPAGASCSTTPNSIGTPAPLDSVGGYIVTDGYQFTLTISVPSTTTPGTYSVTAQLTYALPTSDIIQRGFSAVSPASSGGVSPSSINIQQAAAPVFVMITVVVNPAHPVAVGGEILPINQLQVLLPWLALIAALSILSVHAMVRRRRTRKN